MKIAVIGGGAAGTSVLDTLIRHPAFEDGRAKITLIEPNKQVGPGRAYKGDGDYALINRPAPFMSIRIDEPRHFVDWVHHEIGPEAAEHEFVPRSLFGAYLSDQFRKLVELSRDLGSPLSVISTSASAIYCESGKIRVVTAQDESIKFDAAILCIGTAEPSDIFGLSGSPGFISEPYPIWLTCAGIKPTERVAVLGSSLTAMDVVLGLRNQKHIGPVTLMTRRGILPAVRQPHRDLTLYHLSKEAIVGSCGPDGYLSVSRLVELVKTEFERHGVPFSLVKAEFSLRQDPVERLYRHLRQIDSADSWQPLLIKIANDFIELVWSRLHDADRKSFLETYHPFFMSLCNPMPPRTARAIANFLETERLSIAVGVRFIEPDASGGFVVSDGDRRFRADWIVNASRPETGGVGRLGQPLVRALTGAGDAQINPLGGIKVDPESLRVIRRNGRQHSNLFAIGQLASGDLYYTGSLSMITGQIKRMSPHLIDLMRANEEINVG